jgi:hypothetical protein
MAEFVKTITEIKRADFFWWGKECFVVMVLCFKNSRAHDVSSVKRQLRSDRRPSCLKREKRTRPINDGKRQYTLSEALPDVVYSSR